MRLHRSVDDAGVTRDVVDNLRQRHVAIWFVTFIPVTRQSVEPIGSQQPQRIPSLAAPGVGDLAPLEQDVVYRPLGQIVAHGQTGLASPDDDDGGALHENLALPSGNGGYSTSTVTLVGLVTMS
jgi:hypothetical protein